MSNLTIANITIKQDAEGRYCLNDFHKAAGGENKHRPSLWLANQQAAELVEELSRDSCFAPVAAIRGGKTPGTYVCKELVYAYAMWVSPKFHLHVIRTYDRVVQEQLQAAKAEVQAVRQELLKQTKLTEYMTVQQYRAMTGVQWARKHNNAIGTFLANICRSRGYEIRQFNQNGYMTNSYPVAAIEELAEQIGYFPTRRIAIANSGKVEEAA